MPFFKHDSGKLPRSRRLEKLSEKNGLRHLIVNTVGDTYKGEWKENKKWGTGVIVTRHRDTYEGYMARNYRHGFGVLAYELPDFKVFSLSYRGDWKDGYRDGFGLNIYRDGGYYLGHWKRGKRHGHGRMWYPDKSFYDGDWVKDMRQGLGVWVRADTNRYEGEWYKDLKHGKGRFFFLSGGEIQEGVWFEDICIYSCMFNVPYRQTSLKPTITPIPTVSLVDVDNICTTREGAALQGRKEPCLSVEEVNRKSFLAQHLPGQ